MATNEVRLLRTPAIVGALYMNPRARMFTVDRLVELAARNSAADPGIPRWDDVVREATRQQVTRTELEVVPDIVSVFAEVATRATGDDPGEFVTLMADDDLEVVNQAEQKKIDEERKNLPHRQADGHGQDPARYPGERTRTRYSRPRR